MRLTTGKRIQVTSGLESIIGFCGTVVRVRLADDGAWVRMDKDLPQELWAFPPDDHRHRDVIIYPDECIAETATKVEQIR